MKVDKSPIGKRLATLGATPSADELLQVLASNRTAKGAALQPLAKAAKAALDRTLKQAAAYDSPDILSVYAESAGKLQELLRAVDKLPDAASKKVGALMNRIVDLRESALRKLASGVTRDTSADSIRNSEDLGYSLKLDLARLKRWGFPARTIDIEALTFAVKRSAVDAFVQ